MNPDERRRCPALRVLAVLVGSGLAPAAACDGVDWSGDHTEPEPACAKEHCGLDVAYISGNLNVPNATPVHLGIETCIDDLCAGEAEFMVDAAQYEFHDHLIVSGVGTCQDPPFICEDVRNWWVGWSPAVFSEGAKLASSFRIRVTDLDTDETLEQHALDATYETFEAIACEPPRLRNGDRERVTCTQFIAAWE
jgi:hypothetical protein